MTKKRKLKKWIIFLIIGVAFVEFFSYQLLKEDEVVVVDDSKELEEPPKESEVKEEPKQEEKEEINMIWIDIKGEVKNPGAYEMKEGLRVIDAIKKAGGLTKNADTKANNLSKRLTDEMLIIIYSKKELESFLETEKKEEVIEENCLLDGNDSCALENKDDNKTDVLKKVSINTGTLEELMTLPGIKEAKAQSIIDYRNKQLFTSLEEIMNVPGIKMSLYEQIKDYITL